MNPQRLSNSWREHYSSLPSNDSGNKNIKAFSDALDHTIDDKIRIQNLTESKDTVFLVAGVDGKIVIYTARRTWEECEIVKRTKSSLRSAWAQLLLQSSSMSIHY